MKPVEPLRQTSRRWQIGWLMTNLLLATRIPPSTCDCPPTTLRIELRGGGAMVLVPASTGDSTWANVTTEAELVQRMADLGVTSSSAFELTLGKAWSDTWAPGFNITDSETGEQVSNAKVVLHWVSPNRPYASTFPSEPTYMSTPGLHMVHYDATAVDTHPGQNAARQSRLVNVVAVGAGERTNGAAGCPCLTEAQLRQKLGRHFSPTRDCLEFSPHINAGSGQRRDSYCYPVTYGTSCVAHDIVEPPYCGIRDAAGVRARDTIDDEDKAWCRGSWCYIDPENCNISHPAHPELVRVAKSKYFTQEAADIYFSYETCGNPDLLSNWSTRTDFNLTSLLADVGNVGDGGKDENTDPYRQNGVIVGSFLVLLTIVVATGWWYFQRYKLRNRPIGPDLEAEMTKLRHDRRAGRGTTVDPTEPGRRSLRVPSELPLKSINILAEVGKGAFGVVSKAIYTPSTVSHSGSFDDLTFGITVAVKTLVDGATLAAREEFAREAVISAQFVNRNVVGLIGVVTKSDPCMLVLQYCSKGALDKLVATTDLPAITLIGYCVDIAVGMCHLASFKCVHRDLACRNVLVDDENNAKVADFGLSRDMMSRDQNNQSFYAANNPSTKLALRWCPPEVFEELKFGESSDVWSFGITMIEAFTKAATPYYGWTNAYVCERVKCGYHLPRPEACPLWVYDNAILPCFDLHAGFRPRFADLERRLLEGAPGSGASTMTSRTSTSSIHSYTELIGSTLPSRATSPGSGRSSASSTLTMPLYPSIRSYTERIGSPLPGRGFADAPHETSTADSDVTQNSVETVTPETLDPPLRRSTTFGAQHTVLQSQAGSPSRHRATPVALRCQSAPDGATKVQKVQSATDGDADSNVYGFGPATATDSTDVATDYNVVNPMYMVGHLTCNILQEVESLPSPPTYISVSSTLLQHVASGVSVDRSVLGPVPQPLYAVPPSDRSDILEVVLPRVAAST